MTKKKKITGINGLEIDSIPSGVIVSWYGDKANVPSGWAICDGTNGTPDLRDRFIVGAGNSYSLKDTGGSDKVSLTADQNGPHSHSGSGTASSSRLIAVKDNDGKLFIRLANTEGSRNTNFERPDITLTTASSGKGAAHENRPPYYALYFIMKL